MLHTYEHGNIEKNAVQNFTKKYIFFYSKDHIIINIKY